MANRAYSNRVDLINRKTAKVRLDALTIMRKVLADAAKNPDKIVADSKLPRMEAPFYLHAAAQIGADSIRRESDEGGAAGKTLNVFIMGQAPTNEAWLQAVKEHQQPKLIEAESVEPKEPGK